MRAILILLVASGLSLSGCLDDANDGSDLGAASEGTIRFIDWHGHIGHAAVVCPAGFTCLGNGLALEDAWETAMDLTGIISLDLEMTWQGDAVNGGEMAFGLASSCDGGCDFVDYAVGTSPLTLNLTQLDPAMSYILVAWHPGGQEANLYYQYGTERDFHVAGTMAGPATVTDA